MQMYQFFWFGVEIDDFLFKGVKISGWEGMLVTCAIIVLLAFLLFVITFSKEMLHYSESGQHQGQAFVGDAQIMQVWTSSWKVHMFQTVTSLMQITLGYFIMLIVMSFNVYLVSSVVIGSTLGYFALNPWLLKKKSISKLPAHNKCRMLIAQCQAEECGSLIDGQEQQIGGLITSSNSRDNNRDVSNQLIVTANIQHHSH